MLGEKRRMLAYATEERVLRLRTESVGDLLSKSGCEEPVIVRTDARVVGRSVSEKIAIAIGDGTLISQDTQRGNEWGARKSRAWRRRASGRLPELVQLLQYRQSSPTKLLKSNLFRHLIHFHQSQFRLRSNNQSDTFDLYICMLGEGFDGYATVQSRVSKKEHHTDTYPTILEHLDPTHVLDGLISPQYSP